MDDEGREAFATQRLVALAKHRADAEAKSSGARRVRVPSDAYAASVAFFEYSLDAVLYTVPDGRILDANAAACRMFGMSKDEIRRHGRAGLADPSDPRWATGVVERARTGQFAGHLSMRRHDGSTFEAAVSSAVFAGADGEPRTVVVVREVPPGESEDAEAENLVLVDSSGVLNRPAFVHLAEQQRNASRHALGLVYVRLTDVDVDGTLRPPSDRFRRMVAGALQTVCRWGDVVGRVGRDDFALLVRDDDGHGLPLIAHSIHVGMESIPRDELPRPHLHIGVGHAERHAATGMLDVLDDAAGRMSEHVSWEQLHRPPHFKRCYFQLHRPWVLESNVSMSEHGHVALTDREHEVLRLLATQGAFREIAQALCISSNTLKTHVSNVYAKLGVNRREEAVATGRRAGLLLVGDTSTMSATPIDGTESAPSSPITAADDHAKAANGPSPAVDFGRIAVVARALSQAIESNDVLDIIVMQGLAGLDADAAIVVSIAGDALVPVVARGYPEQSLAAFFPAALTEELPLTVAAREQMIVWVPNRADARLRFPKLGVSPVARSHAWIAAPLVAEGRTFGALGVSFLEAHNFSEREVEYVRVLSDLCALALYRRHDPALRTDATGLPRR